MAPLRPDASMEHRSPSYPNLVEVAMLARRRLEPGLRAGRLREVESEVRGCR